MKWFMKIHKVMDEPSSDMDLNTLAALEAYLNDFKGVVVTVSHDRAFADKCSDHLFVFEGNGIVKDFLGTLSEYASCLVDLEDESIQQQSGTGAKVERKTSYKEDKAKRNEERNAIRRAKKDMSNLETAIDKLKTKAEQMENEIENSSDEGWTVLAELTEKLNKLNDEIDEKENRWMEIAEELDTAEVEA